MVGKIRITLLTGALVCLSAFAEMQPNILFISVDDLRPELGCYGQDYMITPNIDRLADEGVLFEKAFCNYPVCGASRASLMTGLRPTPERFNIYYSRADEDAPGIPDIAVTLKAAGYRTISNGKIYHHKDDNEASWDEIFRPKEFCQYFTEENLSILKTAKSLNGKSVKGLPYEAADEPDESYQGAKVAAKAIEELKRAKESGKPVFITAGFTKPHLPFNCPQKYWDMYPAETIAMPDNFFVPTNAPAEAIHDFNELRGYYGVPESGPLPEAMALNLIRGYRACTTFSDAMIGRVFQTLDDLEMWDDTIVILWGDHGWQLGEHTLWCKHANFNTSLQTPLIVRAPGTSNKNTSALVEFVDLYPTICDLAGLKKPAHLDGTSFVPLLADPSMDWKKAVFGRYQKGDSIRTSRYLYTEWRNKEGETVASMLYDHKVDPDENNNVAGHPEYKDVVKRLSHELKAGWPHLQN
ncbi:sulfatase [Pontiella sulfatireligans]|uniref:Arylsulfatase n=1 Tax=Pontiella sulfatireligans TaxID=2750658 RepID=A0A6C2UEM6_9BACT|nr:sulfatase [Pontiella sulfatireligans]SPS74209.1 sulfatase S1_7 [Kiritimatiellales bacterium]VGO18630.1 Arylsulfatase [Pontiella sulfatireligans]